MNKVYLSAAEAVVDIPDGATIMVGGFGNVGVPDALTYALADRSVRNLTLISNGTGEGQSGIVRLIHNRQVRKVVVSFPAPGRSPDFEEQYRAGEIELELVPQGTLIERIRAGGAGIPAFYTPTGVGTPLAEGKEQRDFGGQAHLLEHALHADFALIRGHKADPWGNVVYRKTARNFNPVMATAAAITIVEVAEIVPVGSLDPEAIVTPGVFVQRVVHATAP
ncbi:MAG TPA: 3-oxoacid CoA-transferase subunit A [Chloroflexota bacterium]|nr:3-oxoacid CoA-transferase subunit A [Chloroflexota bacterium]